MRRRKPLVLSSRVLCRLHNAALKAQVEHREVCGLLSVSEDGEIGIHFLRNESDREGTYQVSMERVYSAERALHRRGLKVLGSFHSHPVSEAIPGKGDLEKGFLHDHELIYDVCGREARLWRRISPKRAREEFFSVKPG